MKKIALVIALLLATMCLSACGWASRGDIEVLNQNIKDLHTRLDGTESELKRFESVIEKYIWEEISEIKATREMLLNELVQETEITKDFLNKIVPLQNKAKMLWSKTQGYVTKDIQLQFEIEGRYAEPIQVVDEIYILEKGHNIKALWSDNVIIPENNENFEEQRKYLLEDANHKGYIIMQGEETGKFLVEIQQE